ncbi:uncharacterized protein F4807DRAFT_443469 [Annulohypoxylon truncatum]|uniref:uncharacterized protein n=1 Tax=Annulohypoxylon truncatum TaxID=327061 RepID=UPI0020075D92|nr:uncharacterized protein F4807DRAFT_443469 [Annulohypoxylon truncatum]KAI1205288.1 hypothetical protein F4807DRAFT_443469 [Annulohypoxylon truncatum]
MRSFLLTLSAATAATALPNITVVPKELTCSNWPFFHQQSSVAGPFTIFADSTGNADLDGNKATYITIDEPTIASGWIGITPQKEVAVPYIQCQAFGSAEMLAVNYNGAYQPLSISEYTYHEYDGLIFMKTVTRGAPIEPHWHYYANGTRQAGTFLGFNNSTTWAYLLDSTSGKYRIRLLTDLSKPLIDREFTGFVRAGDPSLPN